MLSVVTNSRTTSCSYDVHTMFIMKWTTWENISVMYSLLAHVLLARGHCQMHWGAALCATSRIMQRRRCAVEDSFLRVLYCTVLMLMFVCWCWCWCWCWLSCACPDVLVQHEHLHTSVSINCTWGQDILQPLWGGKLGHGCQRCPPIGTMVAARINWCKVPSFLEPLNMHMIMRPLFLGSLSLYVSLQTTIVEIYQTTTRTLFHAGPQPTH